MCTIVHKFNNGKVMKNVQYQDMIKMSNLSILIKMGNDDLRCQFFEDQVYVPVMLGTENIIIIIITRRK